ncbi:MAG: flagellar basal body P-ring formation protein FlgA [Opitutaceae bacterium]|nr:flagellar basal body P-ring formation protein FlgA [Opitutaceae bacterium]
MRPLLSLLVLLATLLAPAAAAEPAAAPLARDQFVAALSRDLARHFNLSGDLALELLRPWTPPAQVAAAWDVTITEYPTVASSSMLVRCRVLADGAVASDQSLVLRASLWRDAWSARQPLASGSTFDPTLLDTRRVDLLRERDALPADVGDASFIFTRSLPANRLLSWRDIARRPLVRKGEMVEVAATEGSLVVTLKGLAMENGAQGDTVTVRNLESKRDIHAQVIAENRVQVRF